MNSYIKEEKYGSTNAWMDVIMEECRKKGWVEVEKMMIKQISVNLMNELIHKKYEQAGFTLCMNPPST